MRFWISHASEVPVREQLITQIALAILSDDLKSGARLPSTRELARRLRIHANTVSAAYRDLEEQGWLELRRGSGVYVRKNSALKSFSPEMSLDRLIAELFRSARDLGLPLRVVRSRLRYSLELQPPDHFLLIEPSRELGEIVMAEMRNVVTLPVRTSDVTACKAWEEFHGAIPVVLPSKAEQVRKQLPAGVDLLQLRLRSVTESLAQWRPVRRDSLVAVASAWPDFLARARTMLVAAGSDPDGLMLCDAGKVGWTKRLDQVRVVICDSLTAAKLPKNCPAIPFPLLAESSLADLRRYEQFVSQSL